MDRKRSVELLNKAVADELQAVHQYMYLHFHLDDQGFAPLALLFKRTAIEEMLHVERLAERILFLKGEVKMVVAGPVETIQDPAAMLDKGCAMEEGSVKDYNAFALECSANADAISKQLFEALTADEERHFDQYDKQRDNIKRFGPSYLALQSFGTAGGAPPAGEPGAKG
jgi:bacterioferritin